MNAVGRVLVADTQCSLCSLEPRYQWNNVVILFLLLVLLRLIVLVLMVLVMLLLVMLLLVMLVVLMVPGGVKQAAVRSPRFQEALSKVLNTWQSPYALAEYFNMQQSERKVSADLTPFWKGSRRTSRALLVVHHMLVGMINPCDGNY